VPKSAGAKVNAEGVRIEAPWVLRGGEMGRGVPSPANWRVWGAGPEN